MSDEKQNYRCRGSGKFVVVLVVALILPVAYVLSIGPAYWLMGHGYLPDEAEALYAPLALVASFYPPFGALISEYVKLWP
jgi:hypothetical protein